MSTRPDGRCRIVAHAGAEVRRLDIARVSGEHGRASGEHGDDGPGGDRRPEGAGTGHRPPQDDACQDERGTEPEQHGRRREVGDEDEPGAEHSDQRADGPQRGQPTDHAARVIDGAAAAA